MKVYGVLDGGGVKGAALAGCVAAAQERKIEFSGIAGTSAGAIVALLVAVGYSGEELRRVIVNDIDYNAFLDDKGTALSRMVALFRDVASSWRGVTTTIGSLKAYGKTSKLLLGHQDLLRKLNRDFGLYSGSGLITFLEDKIRQKLGISGSLTFKVLEDSGKCIPLKIVASDLGRRAPHVFSVQNSPETSVTEAVRASMSYPLVFVPVPYGQNLYVDGGLSTNLPASVFEEERRLDGRPLFAFDLQSVIRAPTEQNFPRFIADMVDTALESGDALMRKLLGGLHHITIAIPADVTTLDFAVPTGTRQALFDRGKSAADSYFNLELGHWSNARTPIEAIQATRARPRLVTRILRAAAMEIEACTKAREVRAHVMLPEDTENRVVVYQFGMDHDADIDMRLGMEAGCSGRAWKTRDVSFADLVRARTSYAEEYGMTQAQQNKIPMHRKSMCAVPIFETGNSKDPRMWRIVGTLGFDSSVALEDTGWTLEHARFMLDHLKQWADIVGSVITERL